MPFRNWMIDAYLEGRADEIPAEALPVVKDIAGRRVGNAELRHITEELKDSLGAIVSRPDASQEPADVSGDGGE